MSCCRIITRSGLEGLNIGASELINSSYDVLIEEVLLEVRCTHWSEDCGLFSTFIHDLLSRVKVVS